eukprot:4508701-Prymnesium_polylepis.1
MEVLDEATSLAVNENHRDYVAPRKGCAASTPTHTSGLTRPHARDTHADVRHRRLVDRRMCLERRRTRAGAPQAARRHRHSAGPSRWTAACDEQSLPAQGRQSAPFGRHRGPRRRARAVSTMSKAQRQVWRRPDGVLRDRAVRHPRPVQPIR